MAVKVRVKDFQSIRDTTVVIDGLTAITGPNNTGKSALLRAIRGVFQNTRGTKFVRYGAEKCSVELTFDDGRSVRWEKGEKIRPTYVLDGDEEHPIYPGQGVPDEVRALGVRGINVADRDVWPQVAPQLSGQVFLLDEPGSVLAEAVANVDRVGRLNRSLKASEKDRRVAASTLKVRLTDRDRIKAEVDRYKGLDPVADEVASIEVEVHQTGRVAKAVQGLSALRDRLGRARETVNALSGVEEVQVPKTEVQVAVFAHTDVTEMRDLRDRLGRAQERVDRYDGVEEINHDLESRPAERVLKALEELRDLKDRRSNAALDVMDLEGTLESKTRERGLVEKTVTEILGDMGECPVCGSITGECGDGP